jgi:hypothetical protein
MQTFLPYPKFSQSAAALDNLRLGKQRVETLQIMKTLITGEGWIHHPAVKMWAGYEWALLHYQKAVVEEWKRRGYRDTCFVKTFDLFFSIPRPHHERNVLPWWHGDEAFHLSHRSNLLRKDPGHYGILWSGTRDDLPYIWPVK